MRRKRYLALVSLAILVFMASLLFLVRADITRATAQRPPPAWPPFTMIYEEWGYGFGLNGSAGTQRIKFTYRGRKDWRVEILSHSEVPEVAGMWVTYNGTEIRTFDPRVGQESVNNVGNEEGFHVPDEWLVPSFIPSLLKKPGVVAVAAPSEGAKALILTENIACSQSPELVAQAGLGECKSNLRAAQRLVVYRDQDLIPVEITNTLDGVVIHTITVHELLIEPQNPAGG